MDAEGVLVEEERKGITKQFISYQLKGPEELAAARPVVSLVLEGEDTGRGRG